MVNTTKMDVLRLFDEHHKLLFRFAYRLTGWVADAEDIVQVCYLELRPDLRQFIANSPTAAGSW
jgi:DNA-directed RNA polymerase specialized sigma24 family protein